MFTIYIDIEWIVGVVGVVVFLTLATARTDSPMVRTDRRLFRDYIVADRWAVMGHRVDLVHDVDVMS